MCTINEFPQGRYKSYIDIIRVRHNRTIAFPYHSRRNMDNDILA